MGPPLTESPGRCRVHERGRTGSLKRQTQPCGALGRVLKGMAGTAVRHRVPTACSKTVARFRNAQLRELAGPSVHALRRKPQDHHLWGDGEFRFKDRSLEGRYRLRRLLLHQEQSQDGSRESVVDSPGGFRSRTAAAMARIAGGLRVANLGAQHALEPCLFTDRAEEPIYMRA